MKSLFYLLTTILLLTSLPGVAQDTPVEMKESASIPRNFIRTNLTGILVKNYSLQFERVLNKRFSVGVELRLMPSTSLPFTKLISNSLGSDPDILSSLMNVRVSGSAITPSVKFYPTRKGYGRGFYISAFFRNATYKAERLDFYYDNSNGEKNSIQLKGEFTSNTVGLVLGKQWTIGRYFCIDWTIIGGHYGSARGLLTGKNSEALSEADQQTVRDALNGLEIPYTDKEVEVSANRSTLRLSGPWAAFRTGLAIGIRF